MEYDMVAALPKPPDLFDRVDEWAELTAFATTGGPDSLRLGIVYGRRRQGKSAILQQLCDATGGFYTLALEQHAKPLALQRRPGPMPSRRSHPKSWASTSSPSHVTGPSVH
jgi:hypothetical protein